MGEPLANYENVMTAIRRMNTELGIGARHITISTVGLAPRIRKLADGQWLLINATRIYLYLPVFTCLPVL